MKWKSLKFCGHTECCSEQWSDCTQLQHCLSKALISCLTFSFNILSWTNSPNVIYNSTLCAVELQTLPFHQLRITCYCMLFTVHLTFQLQLLIVVAAIVRGCYTVPYFLDYKPPSNRSRSGSRNKICESFCNYTVSEFDHAHSTSSMHVQESGL